MPAAARVLAEHGLAPAEVPASGPGGRLLKEDVQRHVERQAATRDASAAGTAAPPSPPAVFQPQPQPAPADREEEVVPMSMIRRAIARRLVEAQQQAALLTTFNEADMSAVIALRKKYQDLFQEKYGIKLGFMSFFVKAAVEALKRFPQVNAEIRDYNVVYKNHYDIGVAIGGGKGLVVPVLRNAERMSFAEVEKAIADFASRAKQGKITPEELEGGTFTISNGGIYGSMLSAPIVNPPQSGILGLHAIQDRPVALAGNVVVRPMMYLALTYDHRLVDGREAVSFLLAIKQLIEDPTRMVLEI
jgi:2-oxoglutarate dehydrogenase E2 component (dihydrolipoamide succinyltransferase)